MAEYGIGRIPRDVDQAQETLAELEAERIQPTPKRKPGREYLRCRRCGETGYAGAYPFSTMPASARLCDDCCG